MAAAPALQGASKNVTAMADTSNAIETKLAPPESVMAPTPTAQPNDAALSPPGLDVNGAGSRMASGLPSPAGLAPLGDSEGDMDSIAQALAGTKVATPTGVTASPSYRPSSPAQRVQETLATARSQSQEEEASADSPTRTHHLYIGNLSPKISEDHLLGVFREHGDVVGVKILIHHHPQYPTSGQGLYPSPYGLGGLVAPQMVPGASNYGFVEMKDSDAADRAVEHLNGKVMYDMPIKVSWAKQQRAPSAAHTANFAAATELGNVRAAAEGSSEFGYSTYSNGLHHVFVGDLSAEVNDAILRAHFEARFSSLHEARVMWDMHSGKSRGYGFLAFRDRKDAEEAIKTMNGDWLGGRAIRINWANQKTNAASNNAASESSDPSSPAVIATADSIAATGAGQGTSAKPKIAWGSAARTNRSQTVQHQVAMQVGLARGPMNSYSKPVYAFGQQPPTSSGPPRPAAINPASPGKGSGPSDALGNSRKASLSSQSGVQQVQQSPSLSSAQPSIAFEPIRPLAFEEVLVQTPAYNTTVYVGNLPAQTTEEHVTPLFASFGYVIEVRMQPDRGYCFVKLDTHENAAQAIVQLHGAEYSGRQLRCSWGKDRQESITALSMRSQRSSFSGGVPMPAGSVPTAGAMAMPHSGMGMMYGVMPPYGFAGGFFPGLMPVAGFQGSHPAMAVAQMQQHHMASMQAHAEAQARAAAHGHASPMAYDAGASTSEAQQQQQQQQHQQSPASHLPEDALSTSNSAQDLSLTDPSQFYPGPYPYPTAYDRSASRHQ